MNGKKKPATYNSQLLHTSGYIIFKNKIQMNIGTWHFLEYIE